MKITDSTEIQEILIDAIPRGKGAYPTSRCLEGQYAQANQQEWAEDVTLADGREATQFWIFENEDCTSEDAGDYPWDQNPDYVTIDDDQEACPCGKAGCEVGHSC